ncbi:hypothetical protein PC112_g19452 [Phytophthora cactorum]|nr:hypothetical protein PC112_g19452 [Phytophthora cactorum]
MPPARIWVGRGRRDAERLRNTSKRAGRMTIVLTIRADSKKTTHSVHPKEKRIRAIRATIDARNDIPEETRLLCCGVLSVAVVEGVRRQDRFVNTNQLALQQRASGLGDV